MAATDYGEGQLRQAFDWAAGLIIIAKRLVAERADIDLGPIAPAIKEVCGLAVELPPDRAEKWIDRLVILQQDLALLDRAMQVAMAKAGSPAANNPASSMLADPLSDPGDG